MSQQNKKEKLSLIRLELKKLNREVQVCKKNCREGFSQFSNLRGESALNVFKKAQKEQSRWSDYKCRARHTHLAFAFVKGVPYLDVEKTAYDFPNVSYLVKSLKSAGVQCNNDTAEKLRNWIYEEMIEAQNTLQEKYGMPPFKLDLQDSVVVQQQSSAEEQQSSTQEQNL